MGVTIKKASDAVDVVDLRKRFGDLTHKPTARAVSEVIPKVNRLMDKGLINPEATGRMGDPETLDQFIRLYNIGAPEDVICKVLNLTKSKHDFLLKQYQDMCIEGIVALGPLGVLGTAYNRIHELSQKALATLSSLTTKTQEERKEAMELMRFVKEVESEKVRMMVTTGAVAQRKKVEVHQHFTASATDAKVVSPSRIISLLGAVLEADEEGEEDMEGLDSVGLGGGEGETN